MVGISDINEVLAEDLDLPLEKGAYVTSVMDNSPAKLAELIPASTDEDGQVSSGGDVITALERQPIVSSEQLGALLDGYDVGEHMVITVLRDGE